MSASSNRPGLAECAPVNAPRAWPNRSSSTRGGEGGAVHLDERARRPQALRCRADATSSLPVPLSPRIRIVASGGRRAILSRIVTRAGRAPDAACLARGGAQQSSSLSRAARARAFSREVRILPTKRLLDEVVDAQPQGLDSLADGRLAGDDDRGWEGATAFELANEVDSAHPWQADVEQQEIRCRPSSNCRRTASSPERQPLRGRRR